MQMNSSLILSNNLNPPVLFLFLGMLAIFLNLVVEAVKKIEIITNFLEIPKVLEILDKIGVSGDTVIEDVAGKGHRSRVIND